MQLNSEMCRICLELPEKDLVCLSDQILTHGKSYLDLHQDVSGLSSVLETGADTQLPIKLCRTCSTDLVEAYELKKRIEASEQLLTKIFTKMEFEEVLIKIEDENDDEQLELEPQLACKEEESDHIEPETPHERKLLKPKKKYIRRLKLFECPYCEYTCKRAAGLSCHYKHRHPNAQIHCLYCCQKFDISYRLESHMKKVHPAAFSSEKVLQPIQQEYVQSSSTYSGPMPCQHCSATFIDLFNLSFHCRIHHSDTTLPCGSCPLTFYIPKQLENHVLVYHTQTPDNAKDDQGNSICPFCGKYMKARSLRRHIKSVHSVKQQPYTCDICETKLSTRSILTIHMQTKHLHILYTCRYCKETFKNRIQRRSHEIRIHTFNYKHECNFCQKKFLTNVELQKHRVVHTGERNFGCDICGMRFGHRPAFVEHYSTHSETRDFVCDICEAAFKSRRKLRRHSATHREFNYECPVCLNKFLENKGMRKHCLNKHPDYQKLPPKGTIMNKEAVQRLIEYNAKHNANISYLNLPRK